MSKRSSSSNWMQRHVRDQYVKRAQTQNFRSRAAFKLLELVERDRLIRPGMTVVDLGAAPGGFSQVAQQAVCAQGRVFALDLLPMDQIPGVTCIQGDFLSESVQAALLSELGSNPRVDVILSDLSPNLSGNRIQDDAKILEYHQAVWTLAQKILSNQGSLLLKSFQSEGAQRFRKQLEPHFEQLTVRKPDASRLASREIYLLARGFRG